MRARRRLVWVAAVQWLCGVGGLGVALRRRHAYAFLFLRGRPDKVRRDSVLMGTALSAPMPMLAAQAGATVTLSRHPSAAAQTTLGALGAAMVAGYLGEELVRRRLTPTGADPLETPLVVSGVALSVVMAWLGLRDAVRSRSAVVAGA